MNVIPLPNQYRMSNGFFTLRKATINYGEELAASAKMLTAHLKEKTGIQIPKAAYATINFILDFNLAEEEYRLQIREDALTLSARNNRGAFYGVQTLKQLLEKAEDWRFPACEIVDAPRFAHRGFMLDVARHFFPKAEILRLIDLIAFHKFNFLHLHLTDDQGWRIEIDKYPLLSKIASTRKGTILKDGSVDNISHSGYYTKAELREIVAYAAAHQIEVIPEIDMPGHMQALLAAYPELLCEGFPDTIEVRTRWGISKNILCAGNEATYRILEDILREIIEIFPCRYLHIGGDEAPKNHWQQCPRCQEKIRQEGLKDEDELQAHFFNHFQTFLKAQGRTAIGWNDCLNPKLNPTIIQHWKPNTDKKTVRAVNAGQRAIISNFMYYYLDYPYAMTPLQKTYNFNPILKGIKKPENILGVETPLWTEWVQNRKKIDFQVFPRLAAVSETAWTKAENKDYDDFCLRLQSLYRHYEDLGVNYARNKEKKTGIIKRLSGLRAWLKNEDSELNNNR
jgi:hexosaminidase